MRSSGRDSDASTTSRAGSGSPVILLHQTPRSWDEYRDVIPLLGVSHSVYAMDTLGFGESEKIPEPDGHQPVRRRGDRVRRRRWASTGSISSGTTPAGSSRSTSPAAIPIASTSSCCRAPRAPTAKVASATGRASTPWKQPTTAHISRSCIASGSTYYPPDRPDLLERLVLDCLKVGVDRCEEGHDAVNSFKIEDPLANVTAPTLLLCGTDDWAAYPEQDMLAAYLPGCERVEIAGGGIPMPDHMPEAFSEAVLPFIDRVAAHAELTRRTSRHDIPVGAATPPTRDAHEVAVERDDRSSAR